MKSSLNSRSPLKSSFQSVSFFFILRDTLICHTQSGTLAFEEASQRLILINLHTHNCASFATSLLEFSFFWWIGGFIWTSSCWHSFISHLRSRSLISLSDLHERVKQNSSLNMHQSSSSYTMIHVSHFWVSLQWILEWTRYSPYRLSHRESILV